MSKLYVNEVHSKTGSTKALEIDSSGRILTPARPAFSVIQIEASGIAAQTGHYTFNTVDTNVGSCWNTSNNRFEAPIAGVYHFAFCGLGCNSAATVIAAAFAGQAVIQKSTDSGSTWSELTMGYGYNASAAHYPNLSCSVVATLNSGDYVRVFLLINYIYSYEASYQYNPTFSGFLVG